MAEIKIEKKKPVWPWILLALIILALILYFAFADGTDDDDGMDDDFNTEQVEDVDSNSTGYNNETEYADDTETMAFGTMLTQYSNYIDDGKMGIDHEYSNGALIYLLKAIEAKANDLNVDVSADINQARAYSEEVLEDPYEMDHADLIKKSGKIVVNALQNLQRSKFPDLADEVAEVDQAVEEISKSTQTLNQKDTVNAFYESAETVLSNMK